MRLDEHIHNLLQTNNCVIVPDFGGFLANYRPAKLYPHRHVIYPPGKSIAFNSSLGSSDGLLVSEISRKSSTSYREAEKTVAEAVNDWQQRLAEGRPVEISRIGSVSRSPEGKLIFKPEQNNDLMLSSFGLAAAQAIPVKKEQPVKIIHMEQPAIQPNEASANNRRWSAMSVVAILLFALVLINASFLYMADENYKQTLAGISPAFNDLKEQLFTVNDNGEPVDSAPEEEPETMDAFMPPAEAVDTNYTASAEDIEAPPATPPSEPAPVEKSSQKNTSTAPASVTHYIIGGSFKDYENAEKLADQAKNKGYNPEIMNTEIGYYRVCYARFKAEYEANQELEKIKSNTNKNAWILSE